MNSKYLQSLFLFFIIVFSSHGSNAQTRPNTDDNTQQSPTCTGCMVNNSSQARDASTTTFSTFDVTGLPAGVLGYLSRDYSFNSNLPIEDEITIDFQFSDNSLLASLGSSVATAVIFDRLQVELLDGNTSIAVYGGNGLLSNLAQINVLDTSTGSFHVIIKIPENNVNKIRITTGALVSLGAGVSPSNLLIQDIRSITTERYYAARFTGKSGQVGDSLLPCINCIVTDEILAATYSADPNLEYATFRWDVGLTLLGSEYQFAEFDWGNTANDNLLGDQDGIPDALVFTFQESSVADLGLSDLGLNLWSAGGIELFITYTDSSTTTYNNTSSLLTASALGSHSGRFNIIFNIPPNKIIGQVEVRRVAPTVGLFSELRLFSIYSSPNYVLPLELGTFRVSKKENSAQLDWSTIQEEDIAYFEIQRSTDGIDFQTIGKLMTKQNSLYQNHYSFTDFNPLFRHNYYRLKVIDYNEKASYSATKSVYFPPNNNYQVYTHQKKLTIKSNSMNEKDTEITIMSLDGTILKHIFQKKGTSLITIDSHAFGQIFGVTIKDEDNQFTQIVSNL